MHMSLFQFGFERRKYPSASAENSVRRERPVNEEEKDEKEFEAGGSKERQPCQQQTEGKFQRASIMFYTCTVTSNLLLWLR